MEFSEMPYRRPDPETVKAELREMTERFRAAESYAQAREVFLEKEEWGKTFDTMGNLAYVRHSVDT
ncbi:MAG: M3 family oligoendopeptidase, partial [Lachnospiraceae bacterium]|nr:M3 family oligoendopeptidase [Lachnospiraceae bacterium]